MRLETHVPRPGPSLGRSVGFRLRSHVDSSGFRSSGFRPSPQAEVRGGGTGGAAEQERAPAPWSRNQGFGMIKDRDQASTGATLHAQRQLRNLAPHRINPPRHR